MSERPQKSRATAAQKNNRVTALVVTRKLGRRRPAIPSNAELPVTRLPPGRPPGPAVVITERDREQAEVLAGYGLTDAGIADVLGISPRTFARRKTDSPEFLAALQRGRAIAQARVARALYQLATGITVMRIVRDSQGRVVRDPESGEPRVEQVYTRIPDIRAIRWYEMTRLGYREQSDQRLTGPAGGPVQTADVTEMTPAEKVAAFRRLLDEARNRRTDPTED